MDQRPYVRAAIDLSLYPLEVIRSAAYRMLDRAEFDFAAPDAGRLSITLYPVETANLNPEEALTAFRQLLTTESMQRMASQDMAELRVLFGVAALDPSVPTDQVTEVLRRVVAAGAAASKSRLETPATQVLMEHHSGPDTHVYTLSNQVQPPRLFRTLSRLYDTLRWAVCDRRPTGEIRLELAFKASVEPTWFAEQLVKLYHHCGEKGLPAVYVPNWTLSQTSMVH